MPESRAHISKRGTTMQASRAIKTSTTTTSTMTRERQLRANNSMVVAMDMDKDKVNAEVDTAILKKTRKRLVISL